MTPDLHDAVIDGVTRDGEKLSIHLRNVMSYSADETRAFRSTATVVLLGALDVPEIPIGVKCDSAVISSASGQSEDLSRIVGGAPVTTFSIVVIEPACTIDIRCSYAELELTSELRPARAPRG